MGDHATLEGLLTPGVETATLSVDERRVWELRALLGASGRSGSTLAWAALLFPTLVRPALVFPDGVAEVYRSVRWSGVLEVGQLEASSWATYVSVVGNSTEVGLRTTAHAEDGAKATSLSVVRLRGTGDAWGERCLPGLPPAVATSRGSSLVFDRTSIESYLAMTGLRHPLVASSRTAQQAGLPNRLVPSGLLLVAALRQHLCERGEVEMWFRSPVPEGAVVNIGVGDHDDGWAGSLTMPSGRCAAQYWIRRST